MCALTLSVPSGQGPPFHVKASAFNAGEESYGHALNVHLLALYLRPWRNVYSNNFLHIFWESVLVGWL